MGRFGRVLVLAAAVAVVAPVCGAMVSLLCQQDCCCGETMKMDPCAGGECFTSVPVVTASAIGSTVEKPVTVSFAPEPRTDEALSERAPRPRPALRLVEHSPPETYLKVCSLLI